MRGRGRKRGGLRRRRKVKEGDGWKCEVEGDVERLMEGEGKRMYSGFRSQGRNVFLKGKKC